MSATKIIKEKLQSNLERRQKLLATTLWRPLKKAEVIEQEYLQLEAQTFDHLLMQIRTTWWERIRSFTW